MVSGPKRLAETSLPRGFPVLLRWEAAPLVERDAKLNPQVVT